MNDILLKKDKTVQVYTEDDKMYLLLRGWPVHPHKLLKAWKPLREEIKWKNILIIISIKKKNTLKSQRFVAEEWVGHQTKDQLPKCLVNDSSHCLSGLTLSSEQSSRFKGSSWQDCRERVRYGGKGCLAVRLGEDRVIRTSCGDAVHRHRKKNELFG